MIDHIHSVISEDGVVHLIKPPVPTFAPSLRWGRALARGESPIALSPPPEGFFVLGVSPTHGNEFVSRAIASLGATQAEISSAEWYASILGHTVLFIPASPQSGLVKDSSSSFEGLPVSVIGPLEGYVHRARLHPPTLTRDSRARLDNDLRTSIKHSGDTLPIQAERSTWILDAASNALKSFQGSYKILEPETSFQMGHWYPVRKSLQPPAGMMAPSSGGERRTVPSPTSPTSSPAPSQTSHEAKEDASITRVFSSVPTTRVLTNNRYEALDDVLMPPPGR